MDVPWDVRRVRGTVPVADDGSAYFPVPAKTPIAVQPLDAEGKAVPLLRSWFTGMPGGAVSCVGCQEHANTAPHELLAVATRVQRGVPRGVRRPIAGVDFKRAPFDRLENPRGSGGWPRATAISRRTPPPPDERPFFGWNAIPSEVCAVRWWNPFRFEARDRLGKA